MRFKKNLWLSVWSLALLGVGCFDMPQEPLPPSQPVMARSAVMVPIDRATERITKKIFGTYVTPKNSPVSPERFTGYHTGIDFETFDEEQSIDVVVRAICDGPVVLKRWVSGYGGVVIQECVMSGEDVTVLYGHLRLTSIIPTIAQNVKKEEELGVLGTGFSKETDGERKHLHLAIHKGKTIELAGYTKTEEEVAAWLDPSVLLGW